MPETINCRHCASPLRLPSELIGKEVRCPSCQRTFTAELTPPPPPSSRPEPEPEPAIRPEPRDSERQRPRPYEDEDYPRRSQPRHGPPRSYSLGDRSGIVLALGIISVVFVLISCGMALILGVVPVGVVGIGTGIAAVVMGRGDLAAIRKGDRDPSGEGMTNAGYIMGIIGLIINSLIVLLQCGLIGVFLFLEVAPAPAVVVPLMLQCGLIGVFLFLMLVAGGGH